MKDYTPLLGKHCTYKDIDCRIVEVPQEAGFIKIDHFSLMPSRSGDNIGNGCGCRVELSPLEFEVEVEINKNQMILWEEK